MLQTCSDINEGEETAEYCEIDLVNIELKHKVEESASDAEVVVVVTVKRQIKVAKAQLNITNVLCIQLCYTPNLVNNATRTRRVKKRVLRVIWWRAEVSPSRLSSLNRRLSFLFLLLTLKQLAKPPIR